MVDLLIKKGANVNVIDRNGATALHLAVTHGNLYTQKNCD